MLEKWVQELELSGPSLEDNTADHERFIKGFCNKLGLDGQTCQVVFDLGLLGRLPGLLRTSGFQCVCSFFMSPQGWFEITGLEDSGEAGKFLGLAVDLGTTRYVLRLVDLLNGSVLGEQAHDNPQIAIGPDVLTRIHHADQEGGLQGLKDLLLSDLNNQLCSLCTDIGVHPESIRNVALAGNTAMTHFFLGLSPHWMIREPYIPAVNVPDLIKAGEIGLKVHPQARIYCFPNIGSYFGGDLFAGIIYSGLFDSDEISLLVDVGTNAEVVLGNKDWLIACAGAAGPALEGGVSKIGKQAKPGVIDRVHIDPETLDFEVHTIEGLPATGICGSGVIDLGAELFKAGLLDIRGKFVVERCPERFVEDGGIWHLVLSPVEESGLGQPLLIGQPEIDSLIRSKAAMYTILETLLMTVGIQFSDLSSFYVAGTFGNFIDPRSAITLGMLPDLPLEAFKPIGNSSLGGASLVLKEPERLKEVGAVKEKITYLELNVNQDFMNRFSAAKFLPHTDRSRFPSVQV